jgi:very-short-patch-repair endonuclease
MYILTEKGKNYMLERYKRHLSHGTKFQKEFEILLEKTLEGIVKIDKQLSVLRYRVDFYIHNLNLAIEYDEEYHTYQKEYDELREKEIKDTLGCTFIRIKKGEELEGLNEILKIIIKSNN